MAGSKAAQTLGMNSLFISSGTESINAAIDEAVKLVRSSQHVHKQKDLFQALLSDEEREFMIYDPAGNLWFSSLTDNDRNIALMNLINTYLKAFLKVPDQTVTRQIRDKIYVLTNRHLIYENQKYTAITIRQQMALFSDDSSEVTIYNRLDHTSQEYSNEYSSSHHVGNTATLIQEYSKNTFPVLIIGETGTGKDKIARQLYENSPNNTAPLYIINCELIGERKWNTLLNSIESPFAATNATFYIKSLASLSKTTGTLLAIMKLYDKGRFNLTDKISDHLPFLQRTDKKDITIQEILYHQSGLPSWIPFYQEAIDKDSYDGRLFSARKDVHHPVQIGTTTWANPKFKFKSEYISPVKTGDYTVQICDSLWLNRSFRKVIEEKIAEAPLKQKRYVYSDVGFILLGMLVEQLAGMPMEAYLQREFYEPMGLEHTGYLPLRRFAKSEIVPSNKDRFLRKETLQGFVHDEASAFFGGLAGNAGLFSTARDVARVYQMLLNGGEIDGQRYLSKETCQLFTTETSKISRRGLGFDKPDADDPKKGNCAPAAPAEVYGHTGFTGTCAWVDPMNELVYVFLSNRIYPDVTNRKLIRLHIRERIQEVIYDAMKKK